MPDGRRIWHLIVDELQDTSPDQLRLILAFAAHAGVSAAGAVRLLYAVRCAGDVGRAFLWRVWRGKVGDKQFNKVGDKLI